MLQRCPVLYAYIILFTVLGEATYLPDYGHVHGAGWFRLHTVPASWVEARQRCNLEGDTLASPTTVDITTFMKAKMSAQGLEKTSVFVGLHVSYPYGIIISIDGVYTQEQEKRVTFYGHFIQRTPFSHIHLEWAEGEPNNLNNDEDCLAMTSVGELADVSCNRALPYFCFKSNVTPGLECDTTAAGYHVEPRTESCYKFHRFGLPWHRAAMHCISEHAHLAVINNDLESHVLVELFRKNPKDVIEEAHYNSHAHIGIWDWNENNQWMTIFGETLAKAGYENWSPGEPDNPGKENCGNIGREALLRDGLCAVMLPFICETALKT